MNKKILGSQKKLGGRGSGGRERGSTNKRPRTDHVISGPMRGLKKTAPNGADRQTHRQTPRHGNFMTESAQWGPLSESY